MDEFKKNIEQLKVQAEADLASSIGAQGLESFRIKYLGKKGPLQDLYKNLKGMSADDKPLAGKLINDFRAGLEEKFREKESQSGSAGKRPAGRFDITLPGYALEMGAPHIISRTIEMAEDIFTSMGFSIGDGPEIELDYYNFEGLNIPANHPARDMHDTFFISDKEVLRTHTSPVQIRVMERMQPPLAYIVPGKVYRRDADISHSPMFHQVEGFMVDKNITLGDLKGVLSEFLRSLFGGSTEVRLRPSYFPFTEPSAEIDIKCVICRGSGCGLCKNTGWIEILGSGMIHPNVFSNAGYDPAKWTGFAFGMGVERIAMLLFGIDNIKLYFENDLRFLKQFKGV